MKGMTVKKLFGAGAKILIAAVVFLFLATKSIDFFLFTTPAEQWFYAYLGFGLTGGGMIGYLIVFTWDADTELKKFVALIMLAVCIIGELATAGFGLQVEAMRKSGFVLAQTDYDAMVLAVQILGFAHAVALVVYTIGDKIAEAFEDKNHNGIPDRFEKKGYQQRPSVVMNQNVEKQELPNAPSGQKPPHNQD